MVGQTSRTWTGLTDLVATTAAFGGAYVLRFVVEILPVTKRYEPTWYLALLPLGLALAFLGYVLAGLYRRGALAGFRDTAARIVRGALLAVVLLLAWSYLFRRVYPTSIALILLFGPLDVLTLAAGRGILRSVRKSLRAKGIGLCPVLVVGVEEPAAAVISAIESHERTGLKPVGRIRVADDERETPGPPVLGGLDDLSGVIAGVEAEQVWVALPPGRHEESRRTVDLLLGETVDVRVVPDLRTFVTLNLGVDDLGGMPVITLRASPLTGIHRAVKRAQDLAGAMLGLLVLGLPILVLALIVKLTSRGPAFYRQERTGLDGRTFTCLKLRTMRADAEKDGAAGWTTANDPRRTRLGAFLRRFALDELPQLVNVLKGEMSLVGPRPERPAHIERFRKEIPGYMLRLRIKAGLTGWAQVHGLRGDTSIEDRVRYDVWYIEHWSPWLDLWIMLRTVGLVLKGDSG
jgi:exopolysaccharide biosynthesis polyprenyl glycosylphosphotransferase